MSTHTFTLTYLGIYFVVDNARDVLDGVRKHGRVFKRYD